MLFYTNVVTVMADVDQLCALSIALQTWSTLSTVMAALVANLMPQYLTR